MSTTDDRPTITAEMLAAGVRAAINLDDKATGPRAWEDLCADVYRAMVAASDKERSDA